MPSTPALNDSLRGIILTLFVLVSTASAQTLPSWNDGSAKKAISDFVTRVTRQGSPDFVSARDRIATFDSDGTLWCEQPMYADGVCLGPRKRTRAE